MIIGKEFIFTNNLDQLVIEYYFLKHTVVGNTKPALDLSKSLWIPIGVRGAPDIFMQKCIVIHAFLGFYNF